MEALTANLDRPTAQEERLLAARAVESRRSGIVLLGIDIAGATLILLLVALLLRQTRRTSVALESTLHETRVDNEALGGRCRAHRAPRHRP